MFINVTQKQTWLCKTLPALSRWVLGQHQKLPAPNLISCSQYYMLYFEQSKLFWLFSGKIIFCYQNSLFISLWNWQPNLFYEAGGCNQFGVELSGRGRRACLLRQPVVSAETPQDLPAGPAFPGSPGWLQHEEKLSGEVLLCPSRGAGKQQGSARPGASTAADPITCWKRVPVWCWAAAEARAARGSALDREGRGECRCSIVHVNLNFVIALEAINSQQPHLEEFNSEMLVLV